MAPHEVHSQGWPYVYLQVCVQMAPLSLSRPPPTHIHRHFHSWKTSHSHLELVSKCFLINVHYASYSINLERRIHSKNTSPEIHLDHYIKDDSTWWERNIKMEVTSMPINTTILQFPNPDPGGAETSWKIQRNLKHGTGRILMYFHSSMIHNSRKMEASQVLIDGWVDKQSAVCPPRDIIPSEATSVRKRGTNIYPLYGNLRSDTNEPSYERETDSKT